MTESWKIGKGESYLYTEDRDLATRLRRKFEKFATYRNQGGVIFAWQFRVRSGDISALLKRKNGSSEPQ